MSFKNEIMNNILNNNTYKNNNGIIEGETRDFDE